MNIKIPCPHCKQETSLATTNPYRPFCCQRCKLIDLGNWASEEYKMASKSYDINETLPIKENDSDKK